MTEKILLNKKNTVIYKNGEILPAVFDFSIKVKSSSEGLYEILSEEPWQIIRENTSYVITLKQYVEDITSSDEERFTLTFETPQGSVSFEGCKTISLETGCDSKGNLVSVSNISAERMC